MKRKDIIIISVLVNAGLLALLLITAVKLDPEFSIEEFAAPEVAVAETIDTPIGSEQEVNRESADEVLAINSVIVDEVDHVLKEYLPEISPEILAFESETTSFQKPIAQDSSKPQAKAVEIGSVPKEKIVEVKVKSGDALEKIARANHTSVEAIRKANQLKNDKLKIGQVLKVPVGTVKAKERAQAKKAPKEDSEKVYYTIKNGDNPWKIAKAYQVKFEDLLKLNDLNEEKAKNLKLGDKIRVK